jgi:LysM repeat protein
MAKVLNTSSESYRVAIGQRCLSPTRLLCATALFIAALTPAFAQDTDTGKVTSSDSELPTAVVGSEFAPSASPNGPIAEQRARSFAKANRTIPYMVREGDSLSAIAQLFGVTLQVLARINRMHPDTELYVGDELRIPNPFIAEVNGLRAQVESLYTAAQTAQRKADELEKKLGAATNQVQELRADNHSLDWSATKLPWWRASALGAGAAAVLMFAVMLLTAFHWWSTRRRFVALAGRSDALTRLDQKYKILMAKAELRIQQLCGRRGTGGGDGQPRRKFREEIEIERLNQDLNSILESQLKWMGTRPATNHRS